MFLEPPHSRSVKTEGFPSGLQKLTVDGGYFWPVRRLVSEPDKNQTMLDFLGGA